MWLKLNICTCHKTISTMVFISAGKKEFENVSKFKNLVTTITNKN
jgi:hypothetical protein